MNKYINKKVSALPKLNEGARSETQGRDRVLLLEKPRLRQPGVELRR